MAKDYVKDWAAKAVKESMKRKETQGNASISEEIAQVESSLTYKKNPLGIISKDICRGNVLHVKVGTTGPCGGDSGHGCSTILSFQDASMTDIEVSILERGVEIRFGGDWELETLIAALRFSTEVLTIQSEMKINADESFLLREKLNTIVEDS